MTVSTERGAHSLAPSVSRTNRKTIAISVLLASSSTTVAEFTAIEPSTTSGHAKSVARARSDHNAPVLPSGVLSSTRTNQPDNVRGSWSTHQNSPRHNGRERKWKPCSRTEEPDRIAALASAETQVRARAVLPGSGSSEHQATGALPQPTQNTYCTTCHLVEMKGKTRQQRSSQPKRHSDHGLFQHPRLFTIRYREYTSINAFSRQIYENKGSAFEIPS